MMADVEWPAGKWQRVEMPGPSCGEAYCDGCGDCLHCYPHGSEEWCNGGGRWVIYHDDANNPLRLGRQEGKP